MKINNEKKLIKWWVVDTTLKITEIGV